MKMFKWFLAAVTLLVAYAAFGQTLTPATVAQPTDWTVVGIFVVAGLVVAGVLWLRKAKPTAYAKLVGAGHALQVAAATAAAPALIPVPVDPNVALKARIAELEAKLANPTPVALIDPAPPVLLEVPPTAPPSHVLTDPKSGVPIATTNAPTPEPTMTIPTPASPTIDVVPVTTPTGSVRYYPRVIPSRGPMQGDFNLFTYVTRISMLTSPVDGQRFYPPGATGASVLFPVNGRSFPECVDTMLHPDDWDGGRGQRIRDEQAKAFATAQATGLFDPRSLSDDDLYYINAHGVVMNFDPRQLGTGLFYGPDVGRMGDQKHTDPAGHYDVIANEPKIRPDVVKAVREMAQHEVKPWMATAFPQFASDIWRNGHLDAWYRGWKSLHPGQEP